MFYILLCSYGYQINFPNGVQCSCIVFYCTAYCPVTNQLHEDCGKVLSPFTHNTHSYQSGCTLLSQKEPFQTQENIRRKNSSTISTNDLDTIVTPQQGCPGLSQKWEISTVSVCLDTGVHKPASFLLCTIPCSHNEPWRASSLLLHVAAPALLHSM